MYKGVDVRPDYCSFIIIKILIITSSFATAEYLTEVREYGTVYSSWAESEDELRRPLEGVAGCVDTCCRALEEQSEAMSQDFLPVLREYVLYVEAMKVSLSEPRPPPPLPGGHPIGRERGWQRRVLG